MDDQCSNFNKSESISHKIKLLVFDYPQSLIDMPLIITKLCLVYTAISRKVVGKNVHATIPNGDMGYAQYTVPDIVAVAPTFVAFV